MSNFQNLELMISFLTWALICNDQRMGQIATLNLSFNSLCTTLSALASHKIKDQKIICEIEELIKRASAIEGRRNEILHSF